MNDLEKAVGKKGVITDKEVLDLYSSDASFVSGKAPQCVLKPRNADEVLKIVRLANAKDLAVVPCSSGGPHTRGDTVPLVEDALLVDLSGMDSIVRVNKRNKVAIVEAGVRFSALQEEAAKEGLRVVMPLMPRETKSVVGSIVEREPTTIPKYHWDMSDPLCCMEMVFGAGELFRTGSAAGPGTLEEQWASGQAQKSPMGPSQADWAKILQGSQGSMGIVTWTSVKLEQKPQKEKAFFVGAQDLKELVDFTYAVARPKLPDLCLILNRVDLTAITGGKSPAGLPPWVLFYSISGYEHFPEERVAYIEKDIGDIAEAAGVQPRQSLKGISAGQFLSLVSKPSEEPFWKNRVQGGFQDILFLTTLDKAPEFVAAMDAAAVKHGLSEENLGVYIQPIQQGRACHVEFTLMYDPVDAQQVKMVKDLFDGASKTMSDMGGFFSRPYGPWSDMAYSKCPDSVAALKKVKGILDPKGVMNPGKLCY